MGIGMRFLLCITILGVKFLRIMVVIATRVLEKIFKKGGRDG